MSHTGIGFGPEQPCGGPSFGELSGGNWMIPGNPCSLSSGSPGGSRCALGPPPSSELLCSLRGGLAAYRCFSALKRRQDSYLVDSASSHMLVSKIKPCMSKYKQSIL